MLFYLKMIYQKMNRIVLKYQRRKISLIKKKGCNHCFIKRTKLMKIFLSTKMIWALWNICIDSVCWEMFSPWVPKLLMDVFILTWHHEDYNIIKHVNEDCLQRLYFDPQKYPISNQFQEDGYALLCKDLATSAIKQVYQIVNNGYYIFGGLTANGFSCSRCIQYRGNIYFCKSISFCKKHFIMMQNILMDSFVGKYVAVLLVKKLYKRNVNALLFSMQYDDFGFFFRQE